MKQRLKNLVLAVTLMAGLLVPLASPAGAINVFDACTAQNQDTAVCKSKNDDAVGKMVRDIINILLFVVGIVAVIMIIVGGIRYTISNGDSSHIKSAKDTVLYAVIGLVVAMMAYAIVNFVVGQF